jgi:hypothetical protein
VLADLAAPGEPFANQNFEIAKAMTQYAKSLGKDL